MHSSSFVSTRESSTSPSATRRIFCFNDVEETEDGLFRSESGRQLRRSRRLATRHTRAAENSRAMVVGTGRLQLTQTSETTFQETTRHRGWYESTVAGRSRRPNDFKDDNNGMTFLLTTIDVFSKRARWVPMPSKSAASLVAALRIAFADDLPQTLQTDRGMEFLNKSVQSLLRKRGVHHFATHNAETKASVVERFNKTLKTRMWHYFTKVQSWPYIDVLQDLVRTYNDTRHRSLGMAPSQVTARNQEKVWQRLYGHDGKGVPKLNVSDRVRISRYKGTFEKGYETNWSEEVFTVHEVHPSEPPVYRLQDDLGDVLEGTFYELELQKVVIASDKAFRVEAVLERRKVGARTNALVKWFGYSSKFNSWIDARSLTRL